MTIVLGFYSFLEPPFNSGNLEEKSDDTHTSFSATERLQDSMEALLKRHTLPIINPGISLRLTIDWIVSGLSRK